MSNQTGPKLSLDDLSQQVESLTLRVVQLEQALRSGLLSESPAKTAQTTKTTKKTGNRLLQLMGGSSLLPRIAALSFLMVVALGLRTLTDAGTIDPQIGSLLGMVYAASIAFTGWFLYAKKSELAPVFSISGGLLMFSIVLESHARFDSIPAELAYMTLAATGIGLALTSYWQRVSLPILVGTFGMCLSSVAIDWPAPFFPYLALVLWLSNILAFFATRLKRSSWLRWVTLVSTLFMLMLWRTKLGSFVNFGGELQANLAPGWIIPVSLLLGGTLLGIALLGILRSGDQRISKFDLALPFINVLWAHWFVRFPVENLPVFGGISTLIAILHLIIAWRLSRRKLSRAPGTNAFTLAGVALLCVSLPDLFGSMLYALPLLSILALGVNILSTRWGSGGMRATSYMLQIFVTLSLTWFLGGEGVADHFIDGLVVSGVCGLFGLAHYRYCRKNSPPAESSLFGNFDKLDRSAVLVLLAGLANGYFMTMVLVYQGLLRYPDAQVAVALASIQSVSINGAATVIMCLALAWRNKELRNVSILITIIGGAKVFLGDMLSISGLGLVVSVFSFGLAAALESFALSRWQKVDAWETSKKEYELKEKHAAAQEEG
ncbi:hypothetical protein [Geopsychrobacter electrodiphilus]|uniref:hypothetical protein n=1 Tax=Geopsychrobacter electrodiphilus TaxID=225196 RepID=UPI00036B4FB0|nr:hypothetical protein [Geopsychrobacter electrodiphilus]